MKSEDKNKGQRTKDMPVPCKLYFVLFVIFHFSLFTFHLKLYDFHTAVCMIFIQSAFGGEKTDTTVKKDVVTLCQQNKKNSTHDPHFYHISLDGLLADDEWAGEGMDGG